MPRGAGRLTQLGGGSIQVCVPDLRRCCALENPAVPIRIPEVGELHTAHILDLTDAGAAAQELGAHSVQIGNDELQPLEAARRHTGHPRTNHDRSSRTWRSQLYHSHPGDVLNVVIKNKAQLLGIERFRPVNIGYRYLHNFKAHFHAPHSTAEFPRALSALSPCLGCSEFAFQVPVGGFEFEDCPDAGKV